MIGILCKFFIGSNKSDKERRKLTGIICGAVGIALNILLAIGKFIAGTISGSVAIIADAANNLSDAGSSVVSLLGFKLADRKPDPEHPFGHGRYEYISGFVVAILIVLMGFETGKSAVGKIIHPEDLDGSTVAVVILIASMLVKLYMCFYNWSYGKKYDSPSMIATAVDSRNDIIATGMVLVSVLITTNTGVNVDGYCGLLVALVILLAGYNTAKDMISPLLGNPPTKEFVESVEKIVMSYDDVIGIHDLIVHDYGPGRVMLSLHAEVPGDGDIFELHDTIDLIERELKEKLDCHAVIHMDPIDNNSEAVNEMRLRMNEIVKSIDERITLHDLRIVAGPSHTNILFDVVLPFDLVDKSKDILAEIDKKAKAISETYFTVIEVDYDYT